LKGLLTVESIKNNFGNAELLCLKGVVEWSFEKGVTSKKAVLQVYAF
jgi:hypothetical protein